MPADSSTRALESRRSATAQPSDVGSCRVIAAGKAAPAMAARGACAAARRSRERRASWSRRAAATAAVASSRSSAATRCRPRPAKRAGRRALALARSTGGRRDAARAAVRRRVGADGGARRRRHPRGQARDDRAAAARRRRHPRAEHRSQASVGDQRRLARGRAPAARAARSRSPTSSATTRASSRRDRPSPIATTLRARRSTCCGASAAQAAYPPAVVARLERGARGAVPETPKPGDRAARARDDDGHRLRRDAMAARRAKRATRGYHVLRIDDAVVGEARTTAVAHRARGARARREHRPRPPASSRAAKRRCTSPAAAGAAAIRNSRSRAAGLLRDAGVGGCARERRHRRRSTARPTPPARSPTRRRCARAGSAGMLAGPRISPTTTPTRFSTRLAISSTPVRPAPTSATSR